MAIGAGDPNGVSIVMPPVMLDPPITITPAVTLFSSVAVNVSLLISSLPPSEMGRVSVLGLNMVRPAPESTSPST